MRVKVQFCFHPGSKSLAWAIVWLGDENRSTQPTHYDDLMPRIFFPISMKSSWHFIISSILGKRKLLKAIKRPVRIRFEKIIRVIRGPIRKRIHFKEYVSLEEARLICKQFFDEVSLTCKPFFKEASLIGKLSFEEASVICKLLFENNMSHYIFKYSRAFCPIPVVYLLVCLNACLLRKFGY